MTPLPRDKTLDATLALLRDGYLFISNRCRRYRSDTFQTRLMFTRVTCASGGEAARVFYHPGRSRMPAIPASRFIISNVRSPSSDRGQAAQRAAGAPATWPARPRHDRAPRRHPPEMRSEPATFTTLL